jgi:ParB family chromosome partitioning protein
MEDSMQLTTVPLSALLSPKGNPRRTLDNAQIATLARSIAVDGVLQNLIVRREGDGAFRVVSGKRRFLALRFLKKEGSIDESYPVPVEIKDELSDDDALRLATVENVQREQLHPLDEAEAFAKLLQSGGTIEAIVEKTGLTAQTIKRRLALANLCSEAKKALRDGTISRSIAEALTIGSHAGQRSVLEGFQYGEHPDAEDIRHMLLHDKPSVAMAIFPREQYAGAIAADLFADEETTYFDDVDEFMTLQRAAVDELAEKHRATAAWVEVLYLYTVPWWQYRDAAEGEPAGVVINFHPSGAVEVRENLARHRVEREVVETTQETPMVPRARERPDFAIPFLEYVAYQKSAAMQVALLAHPRKGKEIGALLLLLGLRLDYGLRLSLHPCHAVPASEKEQRSYREIDALASALADRLEITGAEGDNGVDRLASNRGGIPMYEAMGYLSDEELDRLLVMLPILCFGQQELQRLDSGESLVNRVAADIGIALRDWWIPDTAFLSALRREQVLAIAMDCGAAEQLQGIHDRTKKDIVQALAAYFAAKPEPATAGANDQRPQEWLPGIMCFPASKSLSNATKP